METRIGELLFQMRTEAGLSQGHLCHHLCSVPQYARLEANQITIDVFLLDRIFGRMGKSTERLEYVLPREIYEIYELRCLIQRAVCHRDYKGALDLLGKYEAMKISEKPLHTQFIEQEKAQIEWLRSKDVDVTLAHVENALRQTVEYEEFTELLQHENTYSVEELKLLLFRWDICFQTEYQRTGKELLVLLKCCNQDKYVDVEQVKVFPYAVCLWARICNWEKELEQLEAYVKKSVSLLENTGKVLFLSEILTLYKGILSYQQKEDTPFFRKLEKQIQCLEDSGNEFGVILRDFVLFSHMNRRFDVDSEIIQRTRTLRKMSQETLCEDICTQEELSRVETGKRIFAGQVQSFKSEYVNPVFHLVDWLTAMENLATVYEEMGKLEQLIPICKRKIRAELEAGRGFGLGRTFVTCACTMEQLNEDECVDYFKKGLEWLELYHQTWRYGCVKKYVTSEECKYRGEFKYLLNENTDCLQ